MFLGLDSIFWDLYKENRYEDIGACTCYTTSRLKIIAGRDLYELAHISVPTTNNCIEAV